MQVNKIDIAWAAGLFEGEGSFGNRNASLASADEDVIRRFQKIVGVGTIIKRENKNGQKPLWCWRVSNRAGVLCIGNLFEPFLSERRLTQLNSTREYFSKSVANPKISAAMFKTWEKRRQQGLTDGLKGKRLGETCK